MNNSRRNNQWFFGNLRVKAKDTTQFSIGNHETIIAPYIRIKERGEIPKKIMNLLKIHDSSLNWRSLIETELSAKMIFSLDIKNENFNSIHFVNLSIIQQYCDSLLHKIYHQIVKTFQELVVKVSGNSRFSVLPIFGVNNIAIVSVVYTYLINGLLQYKESNKTSLNSAILYINSNDILDYLDQIFGDLDIPVKTFSLFFCKCCNRYELKAKSINNPPKKTKLRKIHSFLIDLPTDGKTEMNYAPIINKKIEMNEFIMNLSCCKCRVLSKSPLVSKCHCKRIFCRMCAYISQGCEICNLKLTFEEIPFLNKLIGKQPIDCECGATYRLRNF